MLAADVFKHNSGRSRNSLHLKAHFTSRLWIKGFGFVHNGNNQAIGCDRAIRRTIIYTDFEGISGFVGRAARGVVGANGPCRIDQNGNGCNINLVFLLGSLFNRMQFCISFLYY
jgi:hypothetical protein